jgi:nitrogen fixation protein NifU and related proteins
MLKGREAADAQKLMEGFLHLVKGEAAPGLSEDDRETLDVMSGQRIPHAGEMRNPGLAHL